MALTLDVGCGLRPRGDVNIDPEPASGSKHRRKGKGPEIRAKYIPNFIIGAAEFLPLRPVFKKVVCSHVIEHLPDPCWVIKELFRITTDELFIQVPHRAWWKRPNSHINYFGVKWFKKALPRLLNTLKFDIKVIYRYYPHKMFPLFAFPMMIKVQINRMGWEIDNGEPQDLAHKIIESELLKREEIGVQIENSHEVLELESEEVID